MMNKSIENLADDIIKILEDNISKKDKATLLVSGGNTPKALFEILSKKDIPWAKVIIGLVDERWIEPSKEDSNEFLVNNYLLKNKAKEATFIGMYIPQVNAKLGQKICSKIYKKELYPFDLVILGMGNDAHTASLFPNNEKLKEAFDLNNEELCISIKPQTAPYERMSLTLKSILSATNIFLHIEGKEKIKVYNEALNSKDIYQTPISAVLNQSFKKVEVYAYE